MTTWRVAVWAWFFALVWLNIVSAADYVGTNKCKGCHTKQFKGWEQSKMAKALDLLKPGVADEAKTAAGLDPKKDYSTDASCLACHTVNGKSDMPGVGCEACHGAGSEYMKVMMTNRDYKKDEIMAKGLVEPKDSCGRCHNEKSPFFKGFTYNRDNGVHEHFPLNKQH